MIPDGFASTGWHIRAGTVPARRFQVFGERSSGTNFVKRLIGRNSGLTPIETLGWKHGFPHMTAIPHDVVVVCAVRDARAWSLSMHAKPWHCPADVQALPYPDFLRAEWRTIADRKRYFPQVAELGGQGAPLQHDRHPITGLPFANLFALRQAKLDGLLSYFQRGCALVFCQMERVQADPEGFLAALHSGLDLSMPTGAYRPVFKRLGAKFLSATPTRPDTPTEIAPADLAFLRQELDLQREAQLGYDYGPT